MKKYLILASAALVALAACNKEPVEAPVLPDETVSALTFTSTRPQLDDVTRTAWDSETSSVVWQATDKIKVGFTFNGAWWAQTTAYSSENESPNNHIKFYQSEAVTIDDESANVGTFTVPTTFEGPTASGEFVFYAVYPTALVDNSLDTAPSATVTLKTSQTPASNSFDASTDIMVATSDAIKSTGLPADPIELNWNRVVAHADLTFSNMAFDGTEVASKITLTFNEDAKVAGSFSVNIADGTIGTGSANEIVLDGSGLTVSGSSIKAWATVLPVTFTSLNVEVKTNKATYVRSITGLNKTFKKNSRNTLTINMSTASRTASEQFDWVKKSLSDITSTDVFVIVCDNGSTYAMSNDKGASAAPDAIAVTVANNKLSVAPADKIQWNLAKDGSNYTFYPNGTTATWLYCTSGTGNKVRVGTTTTGNTFTLDGSGYLKNSYGNFLGVYNSSDWRAYSSTTTGNIAGQTFAFYVQTAATPSKPVPTISFGTPTTEVIIGETVTNVATITPESLTVTYSSSDEEIALVDEETGEVLGIAAGTATITASFAGNDTYDAASADYQITVVDPNANDGSAEKPYTASEAIAAAVALGSGSQEGVYVKGIVSTAGTINSTYHSVTYYISDDGSATDQFEVYSGKYIDGADFTDANNVKLGDYVVVCGELKMHEGQAEFNYNSEIVSILRAPSFNPDGGVFTTNSISVEITAETGATILYTLDGTIPSATNGNVYESAITLSATTTIKAIAVKNDVVSGVVSKVFTKRMGTTETITSGTFSGDTERISMTTTSGVTIAQIKADGSNVNSSYNTVSTLRVYRANQMAFTGKTFTRIEMHYTGSYSGANWTVENGGGTVSIDTENKMVVWVNEAGATNVTLQNSTASGQNTQLRTTKFVIVYN